MAPLKFVDSHNMVAFLEKPAECEGFEQIQFWATVKAKTVNGEEQSQALVDRKKVIITESTIMRDLQLEDAEGIECLPNAAIFEQLALMGFVQVFLDKQVGDISTHIKIYVTSSHTKKVFWNVKRVGKGFSRDVTSLFPTMMVQAHKEMGEGSVNPTDPYHTPTIIQPSTSQPQKKQKPRKPKRKDTKIPQSSGPTEPIVAKAVNEENVPTHSNDPQLSGLGEEDVSKQGRINAIDADEDIYLDNVPRDEDMFGVNDLEGDEVVVESDVDAKKKDDEVNVVEEVVSTAGDAAPVSAA
ncbi:hypothetical protein Tco_0121496 [Tanacetum coccineum]